MFGISIIVQAAGKNVVGLSQYLNRRGYTCSVISDGADIIERVAEAVTDLVLIERDTWHHLAELSRQIKERTRLPVIALVRRDLLPEMNRHLRLVDDFVTEPYDPPEVELRITRLLHPGGQTNKSEEITCGDLRIDLARYEVSVSGRLIPLTFKEYELLKFLVARKGRVCTRDALLDRVWGHDYYGGDRTVDVHIRRLRSKIEDANHTFIETVRNIGYRVRD